MTDLLTVSVVMPIRNEQKYIRSCLNSLLKQDYPKDLLEVILIDGMSDDNTLSIIKEFADKYSFIKVLKNPNKTIPYAVNIGINAAQNQYIVRFDAHAEYADDYISKCVEYHFKTHADNIGGPTIVKGKNKCQKAVAAAYYSPFALGGGKQHIDGYEGYSDTVSFGSFLKSTAQNVGLFDERLTLNEDDDFNFKIAENGGKIYITHQIKSVYYPRDTYIGLFKQYFGYGKWKVAVIKKHKKPARISHLIPCLFVLFLIFGLILSIIFKPIKYVYIAILTLYFLLDLYASFKSKYISGISEKLRLMWIHFLLHLSYGIGFIQGIFKFMFYKF